MDTDKSVVIAEGRGQAEVGLGGRMAMDGDLTWVVNRKYIVQTMYCAPESCMILLTSVSTINSIKRETDREITSKRNQEA